MQRWPPAAPRSAGRSEAAPRHWKTDAAEPNGVQPGAPRGLPGGSSRNFGRKSSEIVEALVAESMHDLPVDVPIGMNRDVPEADRGLHLTCKRFIDHSKLRQCVERPAHRFWSGKRGS